MPKLTPEEITEIKDHFDFFDNDNSGLIDIDEFTQLLKVLAPSASKDNAIRGFATIDVDQNEQIDFDEFLEWWKMNWTVFWRLHFIAFDQKYHRCLHPQQVLQ